MSESVLPIIAGPTCSGKTGVALLLAERHGMEIISADSRQIYRRLDIGTAKPTAEEQARVRHHLINVCDPEEHFNLARFIEEAELAMADIRSRGKRPLLVGGTGMYLRGLTLGTFDDGSRDEKVRLALQARVKAEGSAVLHAELTRVDREASERIHANDAVRIVRALEVYEVTGKTITDLQRQSREQGPRHPRRVAVLDVPKSLHDKWVGHRTKAMFAGGLPGEVEQLLASGVPAGCPGMRAIGYPQAIGVVRGEHTEAVAVGKVVVETRQYAKRQRTWFRSESGAEWLDAAQSETKIIAALEKTLAIG